MKMVNEELLLFCLTTIVCSSMHAEEIRTNFNFETDGVVELKQENFKTLVLNSDDAWVVDFDYPVPECDYCLQLSEVIKKAVPLLKEKNIKVGYVNWLTTEGKALSDMYGIVRFPVTYIFGRDKEYPIVYPFAVKTAEEYANTVEFLIKKPHPAEGQCGQSTAQNQESNTYELTDENFEEVVLKCQDPWIVNFYNPGFDLCNKFFPYFEEAAKQFKGRAKFGSLFQLGSQVAKKYEVVYTCTVKLFPVGNKDRSPVDYNKGLLGPSINTGLIPWLRTTLAESLPAPEITELTSQSVLESKCKNSGVSRCIFFFLAKSDSCNADCKKTSLDQLTQMAASMKTEHWAWLWTTEGNQPDYERTFEIKRFPGALGVDLVSKSYSVLRATATESKLKEFLQFFSTGRLPSKNLPPSGLPNVKNN